MVACSAMLCALWYGSIVSLGVVIESILTTEVGERTRKAAFDTGIVAQIGSEPSHALTNPQRQLLLSGLIAH